MKSQKHEERKGEREEGKERAGCVGLFLSPWSLPPFPRSSGPLRVAASHRGLAFPLHRGMISDPSGVRVRRGEIFGMGEQRVHRPAQAGVAQLVEQRICNPQVTGSSPIASSRELRQPVCGGSHLDGERTRAGVAERSMAADCKSAGQCPTVVQIHPPAPTFFRCGSNSGVESQPSKLLVAGSNPVSRSKASQALSWAQVAQAVEHVLGKDGVTSSNLVLGSTVRAVVGMESC